MGFLLLDELIEIIKNCIVIFGVFRMPVKEKRAAVGGTAVYLLLAVARHTLWDRQRILFYAMGMLIGLLWVGVIGKDAWWKSCIVYVTARMLIDFTDEVISIVAFLCGGEASWALERGSWYHVLVNSVSIFLFLAIAYIRHRKKMGREEFRYWYLGFPLVVTFFGALLMAFCQGILMEYREQYKSVVFVVCLICCVLMLILSILLVFFLRSRQYYKQLYHLRLRYQRLQSEHYQEIHAKSMEFRKLRHDYRHKVAYMAELAAAANWDDLREFLGGMKGEYSRTTLISTGCFAGDAVVNSFYEKMQEAGIDLEWMGNFPVDMEIEEIEFCVLLSNLLENAVEACERILKVDTDVVPVIHTEVQRDEQYLYMDIINPVLPQEAEDFSLETTKVEREEHGIGTESVRKIAEKYNGSVRWESTDGEVHVALILQFSTK